MTLPSEVAEFDIEAITSATGITTADALLKLRNAMNSILQQPTVSLIVGRFYGYNNAGALPTVKLRSTGSITKIGRALSPQYDGDLLSVSILLQIVGAPSGHVFLTVQGNKVVAGNNQPDDVDRAISPLVSIVGSNTLVEVTFTLTTPFTVRAGQLIWITLQGDYTISGTNYVSPVQPSATLAQAVENPTDYLDTYVGGWGSSALDIPFTMRVYQRIIVR